jgi:hypothetical protein
MASKSGCGCGCGCGLGCGQAERVRVRFLRIPEHNPGYPNICSSWIRISELVGQQRAAVAGERGERMQPTVPVGTALQKACSERCGAWGRATDGTDR